MARAKTSKKFTVSFNIELNEAVTTSAALAILAKLPRSTARMKVTNPRVRRKSVRKKKGGGIFG